LAFSFEEIDAIINAGSLAIVGASSAPMKFGTLLTQSQLKMGFDGPVYLVNPRETEIMGLKVYPDLRSLPETPDIVYVAIPAHRAMDTLRDCAAMGVKGVIIIASGFREIGEKGSALEREALDIAREGGFRIIGPNCFGIYNPRNGLTVLPGHDFTRVPGDTAFISQSGGFSVHVARQAQSLGITFSAVVSYGNAADIDEADLVTYFSMDPETSVIAGYLEGAVRGREFFEALKQAAALKPVIIWKVGKGESSRRAVRSHTGALAGSAEVWDSMLRQCGAIPAFGVDEVCDILLALKHMGRRPGRRLLLSGGGGGLGTYAGEIAETEGFEVPLLTDETYREMQKVLARAGAVPGNPLDLGAPLIPLPEFEAAIKLAAVHPATDVLIFDMAINFAYDLAGDIGLELATDVLINARRESGKPLAAVLYSRSCDHEDQRFDGLLHRFRWKLIRAGIPVFPSMPRALKAIARINL
jgi:acyl-CoA synthetase (NDP forming)